MKVLLTSYRLIGYAGSELTTLLIATYFKKIGFDVSVATLYLGNPMKELFNNNCIHVYELNKKHLMDKEYDLIWSHHSPVLDYCIFKEGIKASKIVYSSLSPFVPIEAPPVYVNKLSLCLANSDETRAKLLSEGVIAPIIHIFPNCATSNYFSSFTVENSNLNKIAIVTNHITDELYAVKDILSNKGFDVRIIGSQGTPQLVDENILLQYNVVITIGKTVQYCFAMGKPVYCYDIHGGPGWIDKSNIELARELNFSGRGFDRKKPNEISDDIINGYPYAIKNLLYLHEYAKKNFNFDRNMESILELVKNSNHVDLERLKNDYNMIARLNDAYITAVDNMPMILNMIEPELNLLREKEAENRELLRIQHHTNLKLLQIQNESNELVSDIRDEINSIYSSKAWKAICFYRKILSKILSLIKKIINKHNNT